MQNDQRLPSVLKQKVTNPSEGKRLSLWSSAAEFVRFSSDAPREVTTRSMCLSHTMNRSRRIELPSCQDFF